MVNRLSTPARRKTRAAASWASVSRATSSTIVDRPSLTHWRSVLAELMAAERTNLGATSADASGALEVGASAAADGAPKRMLWVTADSELDPARPKEVPPPAAA